MILIGVVGLPLLMIPVVVLARQKHWVAVTATLVGLLGMAVLALFGANTAPLLFFGRAVGLTPYTAGAVALSCALLSVVTLHTLSMPVDHAAYAICLGAMSILTAAVAIRNATIGGLVLEIGILTAVFLVPLRRRDNSLEGARAMVVVALLLPQILIASMSLGEGTLLVGESTRSGLLAMAGLLSLALGLTPFHVWLVPLFRRGPSLTVVMLTVVLGLMVLGYAGEVLGWPETLQPMGEFSDVLLAVGLGSVLFGGLAAVGQRSLGRVLAFAALADLGVAAIGLGLAGTQEMVAALMHLVFRGLAVTAGSIALGVFRRRLGGDDDYHLRGALHKAPLTVLGAAFALLSLTGLPLTAGFSTRLQILTSLARQNSTWAILVVAASLGPVWALGRSMRAAFSPIQYPGEEREPRLSGALVLGLGILLLFWGIFPHWVPFLSTNWLGGWLGGG